MMMKYIHSFTTVLIGCMFSLSAVGQTNPSTSGWTSVVVSARDAKSGMCSLQAKGWLLKEPRTFTFISLWKYDPTTEQWTEALPRLKSSVEIRPLKRDIVSDRDNQTLLDLTDATGLFWAWFEEGGQKAGTLVYSGAILPNDLNIGPEKNGFIRAGIPYKDHVTAAYVPDPKLHCK
jgi:hypothetical protein